MERINGNERSQQGFSRLDPRVLLAGRVILLVCALLSAGFSSLFNEPAEYDRIQFIYTPIGMLLAISAASMWWIHQRKTGLLFWGAQLLLDIGLVTGIVYVTGGPISPFLFLYLPLVMAETTVFSRTAGLGASALSGISYLSLILAMLEGGLQPADGTPVVPLPASGIALQVIGLCSGMVLVAVLTSYLTKAVRSSLVLFQESQRALDDLRRKQHALIDGISDGILTTDQDFCILSVNLGATQLLGIHEDQVMGRPLVSVLAEMTDIPESIDVRRIDHHEFKLKDASGRKETRLIAYARPMDSDRNDERGHLFIFQDITKLRSIEEQLQMQERMARLLVRREEDKGTPDSAFEDLVGESGVMQRVFNLIERVSRSEATVLIGGESGTGKELAARAIHDRSMRKDKAFVAVNCGAIPENLIESELFGHKKGSFTGAISDHLGFFRQADGGTIFLDEIGELPIQMQSKLLRAIQEKIVHPVGGDRDIQVNVRIVAATNRNLKREVEQGNFREDLFYRLNVISVKLPPLRERKEDIPLLAHSIIERLLGKDNRPVISPAALQLLMKHNYPGNVRELENIIERALVFGGEVILPEHLPESVMQAAGFSPVTSSAAQTTIHIVDEDISLPIALDTILATIERRYIEVALVQTLGAKKKAADLLGMNLRSFRYRCQKYGIADDGAKESDS